jgi:hypothetical protein
MSCHKRHKPAHFLKYTLAVGSPSPLFVQQWKAQSEDIPRSQFSFSPHDLDWGSAQEELICKELEQESMVLEELLNNRKHVRAARAWPLVYILVFSIRHVYVCCTQCLVTQDVYNSYKWIIPSLCILLWVGIIFMYNYVSLSIRHLFSTVFWTNKLFCCADTQCS